MIAKEWRDARWKLIAIALLAVATLIYANLPTPYEEIVKVARYNSKVNPVDAVPNVISNGAGAAKPGLSAKTIELPTNPAEISVDELWSVYSFGGGAAMALLAGLLGVGLISGEAGRNTIFLLLSKPVSRRGCC